MAGDRTVFDLAGALIDAVVDYYAALPEALPARQYVSNGLEAYTCDQLSVRCVRTYPIVGDSTDERARRVQGFTRRAGEFGISLIRCVPTITDTGKWPSDQAIEASALDVLTDAETVALAVIDAYGDGRLPACGGVSFIGWAAYGPEGGLAGGITSVGLVLD